MKNNIPIYDIDGMLLNDSNLTVETAKERIKHYEEKMKEVTNNPEEAAKKLSIYKTYIINLQSFILKQYMLYGAGAPKTTTTDQIKEAMESLKKEVEMDEYVEPIEEIKDDE